MSELDKLLEGVEVEWKKLGDVTQILNGYAFKSSRYVGEGIRIIRISDVQKGIISDKDIKYYPNESRNEINNFLLYDNDLVMSLTGYVGRVAMLSKSDLPAALNQRVACLRPTNIVLTRYLFHYFNRIEFELDAIANAVGGGQKNMSTIWLSKYPIPIPPLSIQKEIVRILDTFTELTAELTARKKQYEYYREELLSFKEGEVEWKSLGEVATIGTGSHNTQDAIEDGFFTFYARGVTPLKLNSYDFDETAIITAGDGVGVGKVFHWAVGKYALHQRAYRIVPNANVSSRYIYHYLIASFNNYIMKTSVHSSVTSLRKPMFLKFQIPIPTLEKQERIVSILDKFDTLTTSISEGLPKEIELRQKQYEYYRDRLLSFSSLSEL